MDIAMAFYDLVPVACFLGAAIIYQRLLYNKMSKGSFALFAAGTMFVVVAGVFKALHKILYFTGVCDFTVLSKCFFPMQTTGFVLAAAGVLAMLLYRQGEGKVYSSMPIGLIPVLLISADVQEYSGTMLFVALMVLGVLVMDACFMYIAIKKKNIVSAILIVIAFVFTLGMGYLSTKPELSDWIKEIVNTIAQGSFLVSALIFKKQGLEEDALEGIVK